MIFSSFPFLLLFLPLTLLGFWVLRKRADWATTAVFLSLASWVFYAVWDWRFLLLLWLSMGVNYALGLRVWRLRSKGWLTAALVFNLGLLGYYKYLGFFAGMFGVGLPGQARHEAGVVVVLGTAGGVRRPLDAALVAG